MQIALYAVAVAISPPLTVTTSASSAQAAHHAVELAYPTLPPTRIGEDQLVRVLYHS